MAREEEIDFLRRRAEEEAARAHQQSDTVNAMPHGKMAQSYRDRLARLLAQSPSNDPDST